MSQHTENFGPFLTNQFGERYLPSINRETFSQVGSDSFYQRHYGKTFENEDSLFTILGTDGGLLIKWILEKTPPSGSRFIFIELSDVIDYLYDENVVPKELPSYIVMCTVEQWMDHAKKFSITNYCYIGKCFSLQSLAAVDSYHPPYIRVWSDYDRMRGQVELDLVQETGSKVFLQRALENLAENRMPLSCLNNAFRGKTAIILAGGPSLDECFDWVRAYRNHIVILSVGRIGAQLKRENIIPDMIYAIDPNDIIFHLSKDIFSFQKQSLLVNMYHLNSKLLGQWCGSNLYMGMRFPWETPMNVENPAYPGITVSHQILGSALDMGFSQVILSGFDLCFSKEGFTHASGSLEMNTGPAAYLSDLWVETNGGWKAETSSDKFNAIPALSYLAQEGKRRGCQVLNPAKGAARIDHVAHVSWEEISSEPMEETVAEILSKSIPKETRETRLDYYAEVEKELFRVRSELLKIKKLSDEALKCNNGLFGRKKHAADYKYKIRMDAIEGTLNSDFGDLTKLVKRWNISDFLRLTRPDKEKEWSDADIERIGGRYYTVYRDNTVDLLKTIDLTRQRIRTRISSESAKPDFKSIISQWRKDGQPGRARCFLQERNLQVSDFPESVAKLFIDCINDYQTLMAATDTDYKTHCDNNLASPAAVRAKALSFLHKNKFEQLANFLSGLRKGSMANKEQFVVLMEGYLAEHEGNYDLALQCFRQVTLEQLRDESLRHILSIHLKQGNLLAALDVAKRLSEYSIVFIPHYANLQRLNGNREEAVATYTQFLKVVKGDLVTHIRLGKLYGEMGRIEDAIRVFNDILLLDPNNKAARQFLESVQASGDRSSSPTH